jgi:pteridine reductase
MVEDMPEHTKGQTAASQQQRVALVTGAAKRVGRAIVERLAAAGFDIAFTYHSSDGEARELRKSLLGKGRRVLAIGADLIKADAASTVCERFREEFSRLDVLVNNASLYEPSPLDQADAGQMLRLWTIHVTSPMLLCRDLAPLLRQCGGHVINMVDLLAERPWPQYLGYCTSKAGLLNLTLGLARELAPEVTVNGIAPGVVEWPADYPEAEKQKYLKRVPLKRAGRPQDVAELVHFLCTAGEYITGQIIHLDGGRSVT